MTTANTIIQGALRLTGVIAEEQTIGAYQIERGREALNDILGEWAASNVHIPYQTYLSFPLTENIETYTVGLGGAYDITSAPIIDILEGNIVDPANTTVFYPLESITEKMYRNIVSRGSQGIPAYVLLRSYPLYSELYFQVLPYTTLTAKLLCKLQLQEIGVTELGVEIGVLPINAKKALKYAIACELFDYFPFVKPDGFDARAQAAISSYLATNIGVDPYVKKDETLRSTGWYGIFRGWY